MLIPEPSVQMVVTFALIGGALVLYVSERVSLEATSLAVLAALMVFFHVYPLPGPDGRNLLDARTLLAGFANPALIAVLALLVIGEGLNRTGALTRGARTLMYVGRGKPMLTTMVMLVLVMAISAVLNNIPLVVIAIPVMQSLATHLGRNPSSLMMPLSFAAILGGMTTLIGSSTNLLVSSALVEVGEAPLGFFSITVPGVLLASVGLVYVLFVAPRLLPDRAPMANALFERGGRQFVVQVTVSPDSPLVGQQAVGGFFPGLRDLTVMMLQRGEHAELPPFGELEIQPGDVMMVAATRDALEAAFANDPGLLHPELGEREAPPMDAPWRVGNQVFAEAMVTPTSRLVGRNLEQIGFRYQYRCIVCGIQRRARMIRQRLTQIRLEPGDVLLLQGRRGDISALRNSPDVLLIEWTARDLPSAVHGQRALAIFAAVVLVAAAGLAPIAIAAFCGAGAMIGVGTLNLRQAGRAIDRKVLLMIPTALALSAALDHTGGAAFLAHGVIGMVGTAAAPAYLLSAVFLLIAALTNVLSNQATAVLFTPIAVGLARELGVEPLIFAIAVVFAANCSFASPIGYQTNVLVLGPGHYRFADFVRAGLPLILLLWLVFSLFAPWYYGF